METQALRAEHEDIVDEAVEAWTRTLPKALAARLMRENRVPAAQVRNLEEVTADPHMHKRGMLHDIDHPEMGKVVLPASPLRFHGSPDPSIQLSSAVGANTDDVLKEWLDMDDTAVSNLERFEGSRMSQTLRIINPNWNTAVTESMSSALDGMRHDGGPQLDCVSLEGGPSALKARQIRYASRRSSRKTPNPTTRRMRLRHRVLSRSPPTAYARTSS